MKKLIRIIAVVMAAAMLVMLASCGGDENKSETTTAKATDVTTTVANETSGKTAVSTTKAAGSTTKTTAKAAGKIPQSITNMAGYSTIGNLIARTTNKKGNASAAFVKGLKGYKLTIMNAWEPPKTGKIYESTQWCIKQVQDEYGVTITNTGFFTSYNEKLTANLAARTAEAQIYMVQNFNFASYFKNGYLCDLTTAMSKSGVDFSDPWYNTNAKAFLNINFKQYGWISYGADYTFPYGILYNKNLIKKAKLTDPETLVNNGKWTWKTLEQYASKLTKGDVKGFGTANTTLMLASMAATKGSSIVSVKRGASPTPNLSSQVNKDCMTTIAKWCNKFCDTFSNKDWTYPKVSFTQGKVAMLYTSHDAIKQKLQNKAFTDSLGFVPFPTETDTKKFTNVSIPQFIWFIPSQHKNEADKALFVQNELYRQTYRFTQRNFDINWRTYFDSTDTINMACNMMYSKGNFSTVYDWTSICETGNVQTSSILRYAIDNNGAVQQAITKYQDALNKAYKSVWDGYRITGKV